MAANGKALAIGGLALVALFGFAASANASTRPPYLQPLEPIDIEDIDAAICLAIESGLTNPGEIALAVALRVYPEVQWPPVPKDHPDVPTMWELITLRVADFDPASCVAPSPDLPPPPDQPGPSAPVSDAPGGGGGRFVPISADGPTRNPIFLVRHVFGLTAQDQKTGTLIFRIIEAMTRSLANLALYSRPQANPGGTTTTIEGQPYDIGRAWYPYHKPVAALLLSGRWPARNLNARGNKAGSGSDYGAPWVPPFEIIGNVPMLGGYDARELPPDHPLMLPPLQWLQAAGGSVPRLWQQFAGDTGAQLPSVDGRDAMPSPMPPPPNSAPVAFGRMG